MADFEQLSDIFTPELYNIEIKLDSENLTFSGKVEINGKLKQTGSSVFIHSKELNIWKAYIDDQLVEASEINAKTNVTELKSETLLTSGEHKINIVFDGKISETMHGIYPCDFDNNGQKDRIIATQLESHHAREAFPCIDEPAAKAVFKLSLTTSQNKTVISNTEVVSQENNNNFMVTSFAPTPIMSTYLLGFVVGNLQNKQAQTDSGIKIGAYATANNINYVDFALQTAVRAMEYYEKYFEIPYPLKKCDFIALPEFDAGAMENWGCITFRESAMLVDPKNTNIKSKQFVAQVIAHELAHQWFGNLVTMQWWTDLWLNEGFATWMEYFVTDKLFPDWQMWTQFITDETSPALKLDALQNTHPVVVKINNPDEISSIFDAISYNKGSCMIRMAHDYVGDENFRLGIIEYLKTYSYSNATTKDLWSMLTKISYKRVDDLMSVWTDKSGFPVLKVKVIGDTLQISQEKFNLLKVDSNNETSADDIWPIPLYSNINLPDDILNQKSLELDIGSQANDAFFNNDFAGFYRVAYPPTHIEKLCNLISQKQISPINRLSVLNDSMEMAKSGNSRTLDVLNMLKCFNNEDDAAVWQSISEHLMTLYNLLGDRGLDTSIRSFVRNISRAQAARVGWQNMPGESYFDSLLRPTISSLAIFGGNHLAIEQALQLFGDGSKTDTIPPDVRSIVYKAAIKYGNNNAFNILLEAYKKTDFADELQMLTAALTKTENLQEIEQCLELIKTDSVRQQDLQVWIAHLSGSPYSSNITWQWLTDNWQWLAEKLKGTHGIVKMPLYAASQLGEEFLNNYQNFFESVKTSDMERSIAQGIEQIKWRTAWAERDGQTILDFFGEYDKRYSDQ